MQTEVYEMKMEYIYPKMEVVDFEAMDVIATSGLIYDPDGENSDGNIVVWPGNG